MKNIILLIILCGIISCKPQEESLQNKVTFPTVENDTIPYISLVPDYKRPIPCTKEQSHKLIEDQRKRYLANTLEHKLFEFEFKTLKNKLFSSRDIKNKTTIFNFYYPNCAAGNDDLENELPKLLDEFGNREDVVIVAIFMRASQNRGKISAIKNDLYNDNRIVCLALSKEHYKYFNANASPSRIVVDKYGIVKQYLFNIVDDAKLNKIDSITAS